MENVMLDLSKFKKSVLKEVIIDGVSIYLRRLTIKGREKIDEIIANFQVEDNPNAYPVGLKEAVLLATVCDKEGSLAFVTVKDLEDLDANFCDKMYLEAVAFNGIFKPVADRVSEFLEKKD